MTEDYSNHMEFIMRLVQSWKLFWNVYAQETKHLAKNKLLFTISNQKQCVA